MEKFIDIISNTVENAFEEAGYDRGLGRVVVSNRPDLCRFQCNGAMAGAKKYHRAPIEIADSVTDILNKNDIFDGVCTVKPGFININVSGSFLSKYLDCMTKSDKFGFEIKKPVKAVLDYGGPNVAKPLHVGHLRSAVIGESLKRIKKYAGDEVISDVHLGDWGLQMGLIIAELQERKPDLPYFDENFKGEYPKDAPFTIGELEEIYPAASQKSKEDKDFLAKAHDNTVRLQQRYEPYMAIWRHIMDVSVADMKENYRKLNVEFDLWLGESDAQAYIPDLIRKLKDEGIAYESEGALVVDIAREGDSKEFPPCIIQKSDGATLYATTDLATIVQRNQDYHPDQYIYLTDKRQSLHFLQVFRTAEKAGLVDENAKLYHLGFGTVNGKDGKPFKTREGGVLRLEKLIEEVCEAVRSKMNMSEFKDEKEAERTAEIIGLAAIKYGDLSNQISKDYVFDIEKFSSFEGNTGPYILYTIVRIKSILNKYVSCGGDVKDTRIIEPGSDIEENLMLSVSQFADTMESAYNDMAPNRICAYIYDLSNNFNSFYHSTRILSEENLSKKEGYIALISLTLDILETCIELLGFESPDRM